MNWKQIKVSKNKKMSNIKELLELKKKYLKILGKGWKLNNCQNWNEVKNCQNWNEAKNCQNWNEVKLIRNEILTGLFFPSNFNKNLDHEFYKSSSRPNFLLSFIYII